MLVPISIAVVSASPPITKPPHLAPSPIDEIVEYPALNVPSTVIVTWSATRRKTPSLTVIVSPAGITRSDVR